MRRVDAEGDSRGVVGQEKAGARSRSRLRRAAIEWLERRELLSTSTLPSAIAQGQSFVGGGITAAPNSSAPSVAIDPLNANKLVAAWTTYDPGNKLDGPNGQVTTYAQGAYSIDGGLHWFSLPNATAADVQSDFSVPPPTGAPQPNFAQTTDATVAFGRDETAYLLTATHNAATGLTTTAAGVLDLQKWNFSGTTPVSQTFARAAYDQYSRFGLTSSFVNPIYRWQGGDGAITPTLAVDSNLASFNTGTSTQTDQFAGNVYVAWETNDTPPQNVTENPNTIKLMASSDNGQSFTYQTYLSDHGLGNTYDSPRIAISQGTSTVAGGQVTIVYDNAGPGSNNAPYYDIVETKKTAGAADVHADSPTNVPINLAVKDGIASGVDAFTPTVIPIQVNVADPKFLSLQNLTLTLSLTYPTLGNTSATLTAPDGTTVTLWNNATNNAGQATNSPGVLTGANVGASAQGPYIGTVLDSTAHRSIFDGSTAAPYTGHFRPFGNLQGAFRNSQLNGLWKLTITDFRNETLGATTPLPTLYGASLDLTSGYSDISPNGAGTTVGLSYLNSGTKTYTDGIQGIPVLPAASIASDNTLGLSANSPHQGRLYIALTNDNFIAATGANTTSTFIQLYYSDNFGASWTYAGIVNDDNGQADGFSTGGYALAGSGVSPAGGTISTPALGFGAIEANVRPKIEPQVAVDPDTGTLVVSFLDTRNDASAVRVANYVAVSDDGGASFAPETYANPTSNATLLPTFNAITGAAVNLGPIPDNESAGSNNREATYGFGQRQGLAVLNGHIIPVWSSNQNAGSALLNTKAYLNIESASMTFAAGPRVLASTQGPVGEAGDAVNTTRAADGSPVADTIVLTFDRPVDPSTFPADGATIGTSPIQVFYYSPGSVLGSNGVPLRVLSVTPGANNTAYTIKFAPAGHGVGTYAYTLHPTVRGLLPYQARTTGSTTTLTGNLLDQTTDGTPGASNDAYSVPTGRNSLPLVVPGPHVISTGVVGVNGTVSTGADNLVNNDNANSINVTFDRDIQVSTFTPAQVLSITGPTGRIDGPQRFSSTGTARNYAYSGAYQLIPKAGTLTSTIPIANTGLKVSSLTVQVNITDPNDASLQLILEAPDGTMVPLVAAGTASGANFTNTTFGDAPAANGLTSTIPAGVAPYSLTYQPASPLSALAGLSLDGNWKLLVTDSTAGPTPQGRLNAWSLNVTPQVPKGAGTELDSTLAITSYADNSFLISHLAVQLNISSTNNADLQINLVSPKQANGSQIIVPLVASKAASGANFAFTTFDDNATIAIGSGAAPYNLTYRPSSPLSALDGLSLNGTWTLQIINPNADASVTTLTSWSLIATPTLTVTPVNASKGAAREFTVGFPTQILSGTYSVVLSPNILSVTANPANPSTGTPLDTNLNAGVDALRGTSTSGTTTTVSFPATAVPVAIPYAPSSTSPASLASQISVTDNFAIQGDTLTKSGLTVSLNISYYYDPDLTVTLTSPSGKKVTLFANIGKGSGSTANFTNTTLSDTITPPAPISAAAAPFFGTFNPKVDLSAFATDLAGNQAFSAGLWTLTITNAGTDPGATVDAQYPPKLLSWSLAFQKPQVSTGLGEAVADQKTASFRLFNINPSNPLANDTWTAVGPAGTTSLSNPATGDPGGVNLGGPVSVVALDPSDPSGNTAFVGASSGGVWKTTNFLTTASIGPTYIPLTDFGANYSINIGSIAVFGRNNDPNQSIVYAGTGDAQSGLANAGNSTQGVGILRSTNGGASFTLLDSSTNVDASGNPLPENSPLRDHFFVGLTTYKIVVDPTPLLGGAIVYAALAGPHGGLWRSLDGGDHWTLLKSGAATDVILDTASASVSTGNLDILYAAFALDGIYKSPNRGQSFTKLAGSVGATNLIQNSTVFPAAPLRVTDANPNGSTGRIILAKPALTNNAAQNILYQDWLYAAVENNGKFQGLYVTKDGGENWTLARISNDPTPASASAVTEALPTNDNTQANNYDVTNPTGGNGSGGGVQVQDGNTAFSMAIDPSNPNIVYLGGTQDYQASGLIRVDLTGIYDAHAYVPFANDRNDGGKLAIDSSGRTNYASTGLGLPYYEGTSPNGFTGNTYLNLRHDPNNLFDANSTLFVFNSSLFSNDGTGVKWTPIDQRYGAPLNGSSNIHQLLTVVDPLTGLTRLIVSDDQGVFTGVYNADGTLDTNAIGTAATIVTGSRNGNLQDEQLYYSAAQPSALAATTAGALFYGSGIGMTDARSSATLLSTGNLTWTVAGTSYGDIQNVLGTEDRGGTGIATDQTGGVTANNPNGNPAVYEYDVPILGGDLTNFFRVQTTARTTGLVNNYTVEFPATNVVRGGSPTSPLGLFEVNPINGSQVLISSTLGNLYETTNQGLQWLQIGSGSTDFDTSYAPAVAYGAPDPNGPNGIGNLDNFIYVGTNGGHIYVTQTGAGPWTSISGGLDSSGVVAIYTNPNRGSHEAYAVTKQGVYYMANSVASGATWVNITGNLTQIQHNPNGDPTFAENALLGTSNGQLGGFRSIVADYRYSVPDPVTPTTVYPVLYVAGYGGVFRSLDNGQTWTAFPNTAFDSAPVDGGYLPQVDVTSLQLNLGAINPATGHPTQVTGDPEVLLASTLGRGDFAIRLAPDVFPTTIHFDPALPNPPGYSDSGASNSDRITNVLMPVIDGNSEISNFGNTVTITLIDESNGHVLSTGTTDQFGNFSVQVVNDGTDPSFFQSSTTLNDKVVGIQATDSSGAKGNVTLFKYTLLRTLPATPSTPVLEAKYDTGRSNSDDVTNIEIPAPTPGGTPNYVAPVFDVVTVTAPGGLPTAMTVELFRATSSSGPFTLVATSVSNGGTAPLSDVSLQALAQAGNLNGTYYYEADAIDVAGNVSAKSGVLAVTVVTTTPPTLPAPTLDPASNSGLDKTKAITNVTKPTFDATGLLPGDQLFLYRSSGGKAPTLVGTGPINTTGAPIAAMVADAAGAVPDGVYQYYVVQQDLAGNVSNYSTPISVTVSTAIPASPTIALLTSDDTGLPSHPNVTNVRVPHFIGTAQYNSGTNFPLAILNAATGQVLGSTFPAANGTYLVQITTPLPDGVYTLKARTTNLAGTFSFSAPLTITVLGTGPMIPPNLHLLQADDTGIQGDGVTSNHNPRFTGFTDASPTGDTVFLYALVNGQLVGPEAMATASTLTGAFTFKLPFDLTDGTTQLVAQTVDIANNKGQFSSPYTVRITTTTGDYQARGAAQLTVFDPYSETYYVQNVGAVKVDTTPGRDVPIQYDINGDGITDLNAYRFNTAEYYGFVSNNTINDQQFGSANAALPVSGYFGTSGTYIYGSYLPAVGVWAVALPRPGGLVVNFGVPRIDIPTPGAFDGNGSTELAVFRPSTVAGNDADSFSVIGPKGIYVASFTNPGIPTAARSGYAYKPGDIPAPADYDGIGKDEFAIYRPTTGQFFILTTPDVNNAATWSIRTVTLNLPGGPNPIDVPASQDYDGIGKADPTVYRPSNSTFYLIHSSTGLQQNIAFGAPNQFIAAAGPLLYRLSALKGQYATTAGYLTSPGGEIGSGVHSLSIGSGSAVATPASSTASPLSTMIALATPIAVTTPTAPVATAAATPKSAVTIGASTPRSIATAATVSNPGSTVNNHQAGSKKSPTPLTVHSGSHQAKAPADHAKHPVAPTVSHPTHSGQSHATTASKHSSRSHATAGAMAATSLQHLVMATKGRKKN